MGWRRHGTMIDLSAHPILPDVLRARNVQDRDAIKYSTSGQWFRGQASGAGIRWTADSSSEALAQGVTTEDRTDSALTPSVRSSVAALERGLGARLRVDEVVQCDEV